MRLQQQNILVESCGSIGIGRQQIGQSPSWVLLYPVAGTKSRRVVPQLAFRKSFVLWSMIFLAFDTAVFSRFAGGACFQFLVEFLCDAAGGAARHRVVVCL